MYITLDFSKHLYLYPKKCWKEVPSNLPRPDFMPTKLVRISDMAVVNGSDVNEGYCALSYSWNQSGEILHNEATGKYKRIDEGKHKITSYDNNVSPDMIIPQFKAIYYGKLWKIYKILHIMEENKYFFTKTTKYVKFEGIIQKLCQRFNIKYIWYDQMCINQDDKEEKHREIRNMHLIYDNAYYTVVLVPDFDLFNGNYLGSNGEEYFKRLWTLEEAIKSKRLLFVGRNVERWGDDSPGLNAYTNILNKKPSNVSVSQILHHAHQRTSTKEHDRVFALIHLFPELMQHIDIDYDQPLEDLMIQFYGLLAKKDLSILLFEYADDEYVSTIQKYKFLPSWTGVDGSHISRYARTSFRNYDIIGKTMYVRSKFFKNDQLIDIDALTIRKEDLPPPPGDINDGYNKRFYCLCTHVRLPGSSETKIVSLFYSFNDIIKNEKCFDNISKELKRLSRFMETKKENIYWCHAKREERQEVTYMDFYYLTEDTDDLSTECIILSEVSFKMKHDRFYYPVIKRKQGEKYYKAIGYCEISGDIFSDCNLPKQAFSIQ